MAFLAKARKEDLVRLAIELGAEATLDLKMVNLKKLIISNENYEEEFVKELLSSIVAERVEEHEERLRKEILEAEVIKMKMEIESKERLKREEMEFELQKLKIKEETIRDGTANPTVSVSQMKPKFDLHTLVQKFDPANNDISLYLVLFERQARMAEIPKQFWASSLLGLLPYDVSQVIAREDVEVAQDYEQVKNLLLKRYKLVPERFRILFIKHIKSQETTWKDFAYEVRNYFHGWISGLDIATFEQLSELVVTDQIKRRVSSENKGTLR